ncbi:theg spermatid protein [Megalops cyprinoides]|uniref:theg spermatid protein n=1 Tax=Megalops cyprinoides TaxID=118141 RepID=UPI001864650D|nr:theg spermatid protein [Megalops cyprinoides]
MATRIEELAKPKPDLLKYPDRRSVYWLDELPKKSKRSTTCFELTPRWFHLTQRKTLHPGFQQNSILHASSHIIPSPLPPAPFVSAQTALCLTPALSSLSLRLVLRPSPMWEVNAAALTASASDRVCSLAAHRLPAAGWEPDRPLLDTLSAAVRSAVPTDRICQLAHPKKVETLPPRNVLWSSSPGLQPRTPSARIHLLASECPASLHFCGLPKPVHPGYHLDRPVSWPVPAPVREAVVSDRVRLLAQPKPRVALFEGFNPFRVRQSARNAQASPRILELSVPLPRKCKAK